MHNRDKYPEIWARKEAAEEELATLMEKRGEFTDLIADVQTEKDAAMQPYIDEKERLNDLAMQDAERIRELSADIARCAIAMGAVTASRNK